MKKQCRVVTVDVDASEVNQTIKKVRQLVKLLKEANSLADELASKGLKITIHDSKRQVRNKPNEILFESKIGGITKSNCDDILGEYKESIEVLLKSFTGNQSGIF